MKLHIWLLAGSLALPGLASADFLNGSFELPQLANGAQQEVTGSELTDWTIANGSGEVITNQFVGDAVSWNPTPDGNQFLYLNTFVEGGVVLSQSVAVTAGSNTLDFLQADFGTTFGTPGGEIDVTVLDPSSSVVVGPTLFSTPNFSGFIAQSLTFNAASSGNYTFEFTSVSEHAAILDGVALNPTPEPCSILGLGLGIAAIGRRLKKRA